MTTSKAPVDPKHQEEVEAQGGSGAFGFFHKYQKQIIYTAGIFTLLTFSITGALTGTFERWFAPQIPYPVMEVPGFGKVQITEEDERAARGIRLVWTSGMLFAFPPLGGGEEQADYNQQLAALRALAVSAGIEASETEVEKILDSAVRSYPSVNSVEQLAFAARTVDVNLYKRWVMETVRVATFLRLAMLGVAQTEEEAIEQILEENERVAFSVAYVDAKGFKDDLKEKLTDDQLKKWLDEIDETKSDKYRKPANRAALKIAMLEAAKFKHENYIEELGQREIGDPEIQARWIRDREFMYKLPPKEKKEEGKKDADKEDDPNKDGADKDGADKDAKKDGVTPNPTPAPKKPAPKKKGGEKDDEERGNGSVDSLVQDPPAEARLKQDPPKTGAGEQGDVKSPEAEVPGQDPATNVANPDEAAAQDPVYQPLDEGLRKRIRGQLYAEVVLAKWQASLDKEMAKHMVDVINTATGAEIAVEDAKERKAEADVELEKDKENAELKKKVEEAEVAVKTAEEAAKKAKEAVDARRATFGFEAAIRKLAKGRKGLKIVSVDEMKDAEGLREITEVGEWRDSHLPGQMTLSGEVYGGRVQSTKKGSFVFQATKIEERPFKKFEDIKDDVQADYLREKAETETELKKEAFEKELERMAREKIKDEIAKLEKEGDADAKKKFEKWKTDIEKTVGDLDKKLETLDKSLVRYKRFESRRDAAKKELEKADDEKKSIEEEVEKETKKKIDDEIAKVHKDVLEAAAKEAGLQFEDVGPLSRKVQSAPRFEHRYSNVIHALYSDSEITGFDVDDVTELRENGADEVTFMARCTKVEKARPEQITRRQWLSLRDGPGGTSFAGSRMQEALSQSFTLEALKKAVGWTEPDRKDDELVDPPKAGGTGEKKSDEKNGGEKPGKNNAKEGQ